MKTFSKVAVAAVLLALGSNAFADSVEELKQIIEQQNARIAALEAKQAEQTSIQEIQHQDILKVLNEMEQDAAQQNGMPGWLEDLKFFGDFRLRYQMDCRDWPRTGAPYDDDAPARHRARFRLRFGFKKYFQDKQWEVGFRLASGSSSNPTSTNQTFGDAWVERPVWIDLAYVKYTPDFVKGLEVTAGKMKNPLMHKWNKVFWDSDVNPEGFWAEYTLECWDNFVPYAGAGYFILEEQSGFGYPSGWDGSAASASSNNWKRDPALWAYLVGADVKFGDNVKWTTEAYVHDWDYYRLAGDEMNGHFSNGTTRGNDFLNNVPGFSIIGINNWVSFKIMENLPEMGVFFDWAYNCDEHADASVSPDFTNEQNAIATGVWMGKNKKAGDWKTGYTYAHIEANSVPGFFADSDFGGANRKGHKLYFKYNLLDDVTLGTTVLYTQPIFGSVWTDSGDRREDHTTTVQLDVVWKFK